MMDSYLADEFIYHRHPAPCIHRAEVCCIWYGRVEHRHVGTSLSPFLL